MFSDFRECPWHKLLFSCVELGQLPLPPGGLVGPVCGFVQLHHALKSLPQARFAFQGDLDFTLLHPFVAREQQGFGFGIFRLAEPVATQHAFGVEGPPVIWNLSFTQDETFACERPDNLPCGQAGCYSLGLAGGGCTSAVASRISA